MSRPFQIFIAYTRKCVAFLAEFRIHLESLERSRWSETESTPQKEPEYGQQLAENRMQRLFHRVQMTPVATSLVNPAVRVSSLMLVALLVFCTVRCKNEGDGQKSGSDTPGIDSAMLENGKDEKSNIPITKLPKELTVEKSVSGKENFRKTNDELVENDSEPLPKDRKSGLQTVFIKGGTYTMGSPTTEKFRQNDECQHKVTVSDFYIGKYEVTQADWREVMGADPPGLKFIGCDLCPIEKISWDDVQIFIKKATEKYGVKFRLPTEEEWEYAARGGRDSKRYQFAGSNTYGDVAWYSGNADNKIQPVGGKTPNELGLYDMSGNVWEWCLDEWAAYSGCTVSLCPANCRVVRGGSWNIDYRYSRVADRYGVSQGGRYDGMGFRLAQ